MGNLYYKLFESFKDVDIFPAKDNLMKRCGQAASWEV